MSGPAQGVFLSYSHADALPAQRLRRELEREGIGVRIDTAAMRPGQRIRDFVLGSIRTTSVTVWMVSSRSLISGWISVEVATSLSDMALWHERQLIACYLDDDFLQDAFRIRATDEIDKQLAAIDELIEQHRERHIGTEDLDEKKSRLFDLRNNLGKLLSFLRDSLCLDLRDEQFSASISTLTAELRGAVTLIQLKPLEAASDVLLRKKELYGLIQAASFDRAFDRLNDFVVDFARKELRNRRMRDATLLSASFRDLDRADPAEASKERRDLLGQALDLIDTVVMELTPEAA